MAMRPLLIFAFLLLLPGGALAGEVTLVENAAKWKFDHEMAVDIYRRIQAQMRNLGLPVDAGPHVVLHSISEADYDQALLECMNGGCGHVVRVGAAEGKGKKGRLAFAGISTKGMEVWMIQPDLWFVAQVLTICLDYQNRLYLEPPTIKDIYITAWRANQMDRKWKVTVQALQQGQ